MSLWSPSPIVLPTAVPCSFDSFPENAVPSGGSFTDFPSFAGCCDGFETDDEDLFSVRSPPKIGVVTEVSALVSFITEENYILDTA